MNGKQPISHLCSTPHTNGHSPRADSTNPFPTQPFAIHPNTLSIRNPSPSPFAQRTRSRRCQQSSASSPAASSATTFTFCPSPHLQPIWLPLSISKRTGLKLVPQLGHRHVFDALHSSCADCRYERNGIQKHLHFDHAAFGMASTAAAFKSRPVSSQTAAPMTRPSQVLFHFLLPF